MSPVLESAAPLSDLPLSPAAIQPIAFAHPLYDCAPFHPLVQSRLAIHGIAVVEPCFHDRVSFMAQLDLDLMQHRAVRRAYRMSLSCINDGSSNHVANPKPPALSEWDLSVPSGHCGRGVCLDRATVGAYDRRVQVRPLVCFELCESCYLMLI